MNVVDIPEPCSNALYHEAVTRYGALVKGRAIGVYQIGEVRYPGLSDIDLLVVTDHIGMDNRFFFSAFHRLPERFHRLFLHEPFILPAWSLRVMRYTTHYAPKFVAGRDVLSPFAPADEPDERWCRLLESYCDYAAFALKNRRAQQVKGREVLSRASAFRFVLADAASVLPDAANHEYVNQIEHIRRTFFDDGSDAVELIRAAWGRFAAAFDAFDRIIREQLNAPGTEQAMSIAQARLCGDQSCADFDRDYAFRRSRDIAGYHHELASMGFPFGNLFFAAAHPAAPATPAQPPVLDTMLRNVYRVRRRLTEYAAGA